jgi:pyruvate/2-oxoglutarate dehydrogenase complex dihydrolipoamide dehydrogenase (E3) component
METEHALLEQTLARNGVDVLHGAASLADAHTVRVRADAGEARTVTADVLLIATGSAPLIQRPSPVRIRASSTPPRSSTTGRRSRPASPWSAAV